MHNCKTARSSFIDLALDEIPPGRSRQLLAELNACRECGAEYAAIRSTLHISTQALRSDPPDESFWPGYHVRLRDALVAGANREHVDVLAGSTLVHRPGTFNRAWLALRTVLTASVRIPVPALVALMFAFVIAAIGLRWQAGVNAIPQTPILAVETRTVRVPVVQEKVVTRVVYLPGRTPRPTRQGLDRSLPSNLSSSVASSSPGSSNHEVLNLVGFEPTDKVKLTVIKGSYHDEK